MEQILYVTSDSATTDANGVTLSFTLGPNDPKAAPVGGMSPPPMMGGQPYTIKNPTQAQLDLFVFGAKISNVLKAAV